MESAAVTRRMNSRRSPLHTCAHVISLMVQSVFARSQDLKGPLGSMVRKLSRLVQMASPFMYALEYKWLEILYFFDYLILAFESMVETLFPPSKHVFNKIDKLVQTAETLPGKFDDAMNKFPNQVLILDWVLIKIMSWLDLGISMLKHRVFDDAKEKEIVMDVSESNELLSADQDGEDATGFTKTKKQDNKGTYKEALEKGTKENGEKEKENKDGGTMKETQKHVSRIKKKRRKHNHNKNDPVLELFESGYLKKTATDGKENQLASSFSYTG